MNFKIPLLIKKYFFTQKHIPNLKELGSLGLKKEEKRQLLVTLRYAFVLFHVIAEKMHKLSKKTSCQLACSILMVSTQELLIHKQPFYHVSQDLKTTLLQARLQWLLKPALAFLKDLPSLDLILQNVQKTLSDENVLHHLLQETPSLDFKVFFSHPPLWLRIDNPDALRMIHSELIIQESASPLNAVLLKYSTPETETLFQRGYISYQDIASQSLIEAIDKIEQPIHVIDACAAPGGKATALMKRWSTSQFTLTDNDEIRLDGMNANINRVFQNNSHEAKILNHDWTTATLDEKADFILVDAPCSGTGVIRRHPDILWNKTVVDLIKASNIQKKILQNASSCLKSRGYLLYSTCSLSSIENDEVVKDFLSNNLDFKTEPFTLSRGVRTSYGIQIIPSNEQDGLYYCLLRKD